MNYREALAWIHGIGRFGMKPGLERIEALLERLGNPHRALSVVHIGGTNGKGSTAAFTDAVLREAGYRVGLYTSPYLKEFTNRMSVDGADIDRESLVKLVQRVKPLTEEIAEDPALGQPTEFEVVTAIAMAYFAQVHPDLVVLEVGLGGRLDATNVVKPLVTVITTISLEHTQVLGSTLASVAREKAGIIKAKIPVVSGVSSGEAAAVINERAREQGAPLYRRGRDFSFTIRSQNLQGQSFDYTGLKKNYGGLVLSLLGEHQPANASLAVAACEILEQQGLRISEAAVRGGLKKARWPGRLEIVKRAPMVVIDGAHNLEAFESLARSIKALFAYRRLLLVLGILRDKAVEEILKTIVPLADELIITLPDNPRAADPEMVRELAVPYLQGGVKAVPRIAEALATAFSLARASDLILVAGSLYTVSEARRVLLERG